MAANSRNIKLSAPSEFLSKPRKVSPKHQDKKLKENKQLLIPPSKFAPPAPECETSKQKDPKMPRPINSCSKKDGLNLDPGPSIGISSLPSETKMQEVSMQLLGEIKDCKKQNSILEEKLTKQIKELLDKNLETSKVDMSKVRHVYEELKRNQEQSGEFHASLERQIKKQAETIEDISEKYILRHDDVASENETLRRKLFRLTEEHKEIKLYLTMEIEAKEKACLDFLSDLRKSNQVMENMKIDMEQEKAHFLEVVKSKEKVLDALNKELCKSKEENENVMLNRNKEIENLTKTFSEEILKLRSELETKKSDLKSARKRNKEMANKEQEKSLSTDIELSKYKAENEELRKTLNKQSCSLETIELEREKEKEAHSQLVSDLRKQLELQKDSHLAESDKLQAQYESRLMSEAVSFKRLKEEIDILKSQLKNSEEEITKLHAYIADNISDSVVKKYESQMKHMSKENTDLKETCKSLQLTNELLNVRLISLNNVVKIQETEISRDGISSAGDKTAGLLNKWRDKVYALLVQLKTQQILENEDMNKLQSKLKSYNCEIADSKCKVEILTNQLTEKSAEIEMLKNNARKSSKELESLQIKEEEHIIVIDNYKNCFIDLCNFVKSSVDVSDGIMEKFNKGMLSLKALESRVNFAKERLRTIEELMNRKDVIWKSKLLAAVDKKEAFNSTDACQSTPAAVNEEESVSNELIHLTKEREILLNQVKEGTEELARIKQDLKMKYKNKIADREILIEDLQLQAEAYMNDFRRMTKEIASLSETKIDLSDELEAVKFDLQRNQADFRKELESKLDEERRSFQDELTRKDAVIDEVQREHTKTIAALRQIERQLSWQKQTTNERIKENNEEHVFEMEKLQRKAVDLERERNLLLTTIKQENIKVPRLKHAEFHDPVGSDNPDADKSDPRRKSSGMKKSHAQDSKGKNRKLKSENSEQLQGMLRELESISNALLQEETAQTDRSEECSKSAEI